MNVSAVSAGTREVEIERLAPVANNRTLTPRAVRCLFNLMEADAHPDTGAEALLLSLWSRGLVTRLYVDVGVGFVPSGWRANTRGGDLLFKVGASHGQG